MTHRPECHDIAGGESLIQAWIVVEVPPSIAGVP
jgi:hypothetical protein